MLLVAGSIASTWAAFHFRRIAREREARRAEGAWHSARPSRRGAKRSSNHGRRGPLRPRPQGGRRIVHRGEREQAAQRPRPSGPARRPARLVHEVLRGIPQGAGRRPVAEGRPAADPPTRRRGARRTGEDEGGERRLPGRRRRVRAGPAGSARRCRPQGRPGRCDCRGPGGACRATTGSRPYAGSSPCGKRCSEAARRSTSKQNLGARLQPPPHAARGDCIRPKPWLPWNAAC